MNLHDYDIRYEALQEGLQKGEEIGAQKKAEEDARNALEMKLSPEQAAKHGMGTTKNLRF